MIPRYSRPEMTTVWAPQNRLNLWLRIERLAADRGGTSHCFDLDRLEQLERETRHDFVAFLRYLEEAGIKGLHIGLTSSDVVDTAFNIQLVQAAAKLSGRIDAVMAALRRRAIEHKMTPTIGRTHGMHAEPITFGLKLAGFYEEFKRAQHRMAAARNEVSVCMISGPVGNYTEVDPSGEQRVAEALNFKIEPVSTQVVPRDRHAMYFATLGVVAASVERLATEIRHLQRSEVAEVEEPFGESQKGSSAMPHKRNPVLSENLVGLSRMVRSCVAPALENVALWHERDISHSSVERMIGPDATITLDFALDRLAALIEGLVVKPENMRRNLNAAGRNAHSQRVMLALMEERGISREEAHGLVQRGQAIWIGLDDDFAHSLRHVDAIFKRVFGDEA